MRAAPFNGGKPPAELHFRDARIPNPRKDTPPRTILGVEQKAWFKDQLRRSTATWKIWGNSLGALDNRVDLQNLPAGMIKNPWPADTFGMAGSDDYGAAYAERREIYDLVRDAKITGFAIVSGDRHSFWAGYAAATSPAAQIRAGRIQLRRRVAGQPRGDGSLRAWLTQGSAAARRSFSPTGPAAGSRTGPTTCCCEHGVRSCLEYAKSFDLEKARALSNPAACAAPRVRRHGRPRLCEGAAHRR